jgi:hypothetical protein
MHVEPVAQTRPPILYDMGFDPQDVERALHQCGGSEARAIELLLQMPPPPPPAAAPQAEPADWADWTAFAATSPAAAAAPTLCLDLLSAPPGPLLPPPSDQLAPLRGKNLKVNTATTPNIKTINL